MGRTGAVTFKGTPMTLVGEEVKVGQRAPDFVLHYFEGGMQELTNNDLLGKPTIVSVVPSLDTGVCQVQTKKFNQAVGEMGDRVQALTVSRDLPFAQIRFCGAEGLQNMRFASDYQTGGFGQAWGVMIDELKLLARSVFVLDAEGQVVHAEIVGEVTDEPDYEAALGALRGCL
ncbi:MAG: thiol peroxidase [Planctomycetota bacterium]|nr:MAG: thiol peroxidase [Planctomycetota bacterium]